MATQSHEFKAKSVDEAIAEGLATLNIPRDAVDIEIVNKGSRGIFGIGSEPAMVRLTLRLTTPVPEESTQPVSTPDTQSTINVEPPAETVTAAPTTAVETAVVQNGVANAGTATNEFDDDEFDGESDEQTPSLATTASEDELATMAADMLGKMIHLMGFKATVNASWQEEDDDEDEDDDRSANTDQDNTDDVDERRNQYLHLDVEGTDLGPLIGRRGETLENIQYLLRLMVNQKVHKWKNIVIDVEHYKERRVNQLTQLADRMAEQVARTGQAISLEPMPANERRIVHMVLRDHPDIYTESYGEGPRRKVHIFARD